MHWFWRATIAGTFFLWAILATGCAFVDPNYNDKMRYQMAHIHADRVLKESGSDLKAHDPDYGLMVSQGRYYDKSTRTFHDCELYEFFKTCGMSGPDRFVIVYDAATRKTYLRAETRTTSPHPPRVGVGPERGTSVPVRDSTSPDDGVH